MADINISKDLITRSSGPTPTKEEIATEDFVAVKGDTMQSSSMTPPLSSFQSSSSSPVLELPTVPTDSMSYFIRTMSDATRTFRQQLGASEYIDQVTRRRSTEIIASKAQALVDLFSKRKEEIAKLETDSAKKIADLQTMLEELERLSNGQKNRADGINSGNELEKQKHLELSTAYNAYIDELKNMGAIDKGNGEFEIPLGKEKDFNDLTATYQKAVGHFNTYWGERSAQIDQYNSATIDYNNEIVKYNQAVTDFVITNNLSEYMQLKNLTIPHLQGASQRDISGHQKQLDSPSFITSSPITISTFPVPPYVRSIGELGTEKISTPLLSPFDPNLLYPGVLSSAYELVITPLDDQINASKDFWSFLIKQPLVVPDNQGVPDPILNVKSLTEKILPDSLIKTKKKEKTESLELTTMEAMGVTNKQIEAMLGRTLVEQFLKNLEGTETTPKTELTKLGTELQDVNAAPTNLQNQKGQEIADKFLLLSIGLMGNQSLQALFPGFGLLSDSLATLPKDSPAYALLFAVSLSNRFQEDATQKISDGALEAFIKDIPELAKISPEDKEKLNAILHLSQLLIAGKLIEESLGLPGLLAQLIPSFAPDLDVQSLISTAHQETHQKMNELQTNLAENFVKQGLPSDKAQFIAEVGVQMVDTGLLTPSVTSVPSSESLNQSMVQNSIAAALILSHDYPVEQAKAIAAEVTELALVEIPFPSIDQFRKTIESHLKDLGVPKSNEIVGQTIFIPASEKTIIPVRIQPPGNVPFSPTLSDEGRPSSPLNQLAEPPALLPPSELMKILEKRSLQLLVPQLGAQLAKQVTEELAKTLFGNSLSDSPGAPLQSPYSLTHVIKDQIERLNIEKNKEWRDSMADTFQKTIETMTDFYAFSLKILNPTQLFILSANVGIIYSDRGMNKIDIMI